MKTLKDYKEEIHKCSKCGICHAVCPIYQLTGNECSVSRGQFIMLDGVVKNNLLMSKNINKYLDLCLKCDKCSKFCPSEIDVVDILIAAKHEYFKHSLQGKIYAVLESKLVFNNLLKIVQFFSNLFFKKEKSKQYTKKAVYFGGCISKIRPDINNYITELLNKMEIEVIDIDFNCCGMPYLTTGNLERFKEQIIENISKLDFDFDYFVTDCASCQWAWRQYYKYVEDFDNNIKEKLEKINFKSIYELIKESRIKFRLKTPQVVTYHKPCHEKDGIEEILRSVENLDYEELKGFDECCGFGGFEHPLTLNLISKIMKKKRDNIKNSGVKTVLTTCVGCLTALNVISLFSGKKVQRLITFLKSCCTYK